MISGALFGGSPLIATASYFIGIGAVVVSGLILKKTKPFAGDPSPFVMELPSYHAPVARNILRTTWERGWSFIKKAGTVILLSSVVLWFFTYFGFTEDGFRMLAEDELSHSILAFIGSLISWLFIPLGFGTWQAAVASLTGLIAKENIVGTLAILYGGAAIGLFIAFYVLNGFSVDKKPRAWDELPDRWTDEQKNEFLEKQPERKEKAKTLLYMLMPLVVTLLISYIELNFFI